jgi:class 3 adenylate cyclase
MNEHEKEIVRLTRRVRRLETSLEELEQLRDNNARLLDQLMRELAAERQRSETLLLNVLPRRIVDRLQAGETTIADRHDDVAVVFSDFVAFTEIASRAAAPSIVADLNVYFSRFDAVCAEHGVEKIKTIGDAYMAAAGLADTIGDPVDAAARVALGMRASVDEAGTSWQVRIGVDVGPVVAGVIGTQKFAYDVWGDTVNTSSRLETTAPPGGIQVSAAVAARLGDRFELVHRGHIELKGKGPTSTFLLVDLRDADQPSSTAPS